MKLWKLYEGVPCRIEGEASTDISGIAYDSRKVNPGDLFFCISGFRTDGNKYAAEAVRRGAAAVASERVHPELDVPQVIVNNARSSMAQASAAFYGRPAEHMRMIGVTGTNGKTTTTYMLKRIGEFSGHKVGLIGTIRNMIGSEQLPAERTTPESPDLQKLLREMLDKGCDMVVMEVSSHSLALDRTFGIPFEAGIFTNLTQDHLDFHGSMEEYLKAKVRLFEQSRVSIINEDDRWATSVIPHAAGEYRTYGVRGASDYKAVHIDLTPGATAYQLRSPDNNPVCINVPIPGMFTVYNSLAASAAALELGISQDTIAAALHDMPPVDGRFEVLGTRGHDFTLILDYAHTPDSLENTLETVREFAKGRVVAVFGCGGDRDRTKRPQMGRIAADLSDFAFVTSDNPRTEDPNAIIGDILAGLPDGAQFEAITDRRDAIRKAIAGARSGDVIVLAGKGHETYQEINGVKHDFDEKIVVEKIYDELGW